MDIRNKSSFARFTTKIKSSARACILLFLIVFLWELLSRMGLINQSILPMPSTLFHSLVDMVITGRLRKHLSVSAVRVVKGFFIGATLGLVTGIWIGLSKLTNDLFAALIGILRPIPMIAWVPMLILWLGIGEGSKITLIAIGSFWPILLNTVRGIQSTDEKLLEVGRILEKSRPEMLMKVVIPSAFPFVFTGIRLGIGAAWSCVVTAEMIAAATGIGYLIMYSRELSQPDIMLVGVFSIGLIGLILDTILLKIEKKVIRWNAAEEK